MPVTDNKEKSFDSLDQLYAKSVQFAATFCSSELMSYLNIDASDGPGQTFYDSRIVGMNFSRLPIARMSIDSTSSNSMPKGSLEIRFLGPMHDRGLAVFLDGVSWFSSSGPFVIDAPDVHWLEFKGDTDHKICCIHFTSSNNTIDIHFTDVKFQTRFFLSGEGGTGDFRMPDRQNLR